MKADFKGKRLVEQNCLDIALQKLRKKEKELIEKELREKELRAKKLDLNDDCKLKKAKKLDLNDYCEGFSTELENKLKLDLNDDCEGLKKARKLDLNDYCEGFSTELGNKLLKNGYYYGKEVLDEEIQSARTLDDPKEYLKKMNLLDHSIESLADLFNIIRQE